ncbi:MAG TPA: hypothetical protein VL475_07325 [Planctomycetaceae bacterium]|nr:hypothetical protein [Planctomycetaceae bacterium]
MSKLCLMLMRLALSAWLGIATFFVIVVLRLRNSGLFEPEAMLNHPKVLFPLFYAFEFSLLGLALGCGLGARRHPAARNGRFSLCLTLLAAALLIGTVDYLAIYGPLAAMIEGPPLPPEFAAYHQWSRWLNSASLLLCAAAAILAVWPEEGRENR